MAYELCPDPDETEDTNEESAKEDAPVGEKVEEVVDIPFVNLKAKYKEEIDTVHPSSVRFNTINDNTLHYK